MESYSLRFFFFNFGICFLWVSEYCIVYISDETKEIGKLEKQFMD